MFLLVVVAEIRSCGRTLSREGVFKFHPTSGVAGDLADRQNLFVDVGTLSQKNLHRRFYCHRENVKRVV